ncbi:GAF domain-containing protein [Burkholderia orbicola]|uniref:GAF domain-containing protein n=1 Tax=Burkholderia orbicola TaxID=2978683 RepID=UPI00264B8183|nr:GAF domain-containing protein [Burkholderia orbicola]MDN7559128.1 GAF domain-containing protein [Burkholderia orbicola]
MKHEQTLDRLGRAAHAVGFAEDADAQWTVISSLAESVFGYSLLTGLVYFPEQRLMRRIFSTDETVSPLGGFKATGKGPWSTRVLDQGLPYIGNNETDIRSVFSEAELLIERGLHSVLNLPVWARGRVIGSLNLLHHRDAYAHVDERVMHLMSGICVPTFLLAREAQQEAAVSVDRSKLESV